MVLRALLRGRTPASGPSQASRAREVLWIVLPAVAVCFVLLATWRAIVVPSHGPREQETSSVPAVTVHAGDTGVLVRLETSRAALVKATSNGGAL